MSEGDESRDYSTEDVLWIAYFNNAAKPGDNIDIYACGETTMKTIFGAHSNQDTGENDSCVLHQITGCAKPTCLRVPRLFLFQRASPVKDMDAVIWESPTTNSLFPRAILQAALNDLRHLQRNISTMIRPRHGDHSPLCFAWITLRPAQNPKPGTHGTIDCDVFKTRAYVMQLSSEVVVEVYASRSETKVSNTLDRPDLETHVRQNSVNRLIYHEGCEADIWSLKRLAVENLCRVILDDESVVLTEVGFFLIKIEQDLASKNILKGDIDRWRVELGEWRALLHTINGWCTRYIHNIRVLQINDEENGRLEEEGQFNKAQNQIRKRLEKVVLDAERFQGRLRVVLEHTESTFSALIGTINIMQAEEVGRLTLLSFYFIPLSYVAGIFGMNISLFTVGGTKWWVVVVVSVIISIVTYVRFYWREIWQWITRLVTNVSRDTEKQHNPPDTEKTWHLAPRTISVGARRVDRTTRPSITAQQATEIELQERAESVSELRLRHPESWSHHVA